VTDPTNPDAHALRQWRMRILASTWLAYAGLYFCRKPFYAAKNTISEQLGISTAQLGDIEVAYLIAYTIGQFTAARFGQQRGARVVLLTGMAVSIGCNVVFAFANNYWTLFAFMALNGLAQATGWPSVVGTIGQWTRRAERGTLMGLWGTCYQLGGVAATSWAGFWLVRQGLRGAFLWASLALLGAWIAVFFWQRNRPQDVGLPPVEEADDEAASGEDSGSGWTRAIIINLALVGAFYFGVKFVRYALWSWVPFLLEKNFGLAVDDAAYISTIFDLAGFAGVVCAGIASDRLFNGKRALPSFVMLVGMLLGCGMLWFVGATSLFWFGLAIGLIGFMLFGPDSLLSGAGAIEVGSPKLAVAAAGIINGTGSLGAVVQALLVSRILENSDGAMGPVFAVLGLASATSIVAISVVLLRNRRGSADL